MVTCGADGTHCLNGDTMKSALILGLLLALPGCAVCSSSDNAEQCRTKQRDHSNPRTELPTSFREMLGRLAARS